MRRALLLVGVLILGPDRVSAQTFADVPLDHWAISFIESFSASGITAGCFGRNYCPDDPVTRAQMAVFLERGMRGSDFSPPPATGEIFFDVEATDFAAAFIEQFFADGITGGCGGGNYCSNNPVSRAQMAVFLLRAKYGPGYSPPPPIGVFGDVPVDYWAGAWIEQLAAEGITSGCGAGDYCPEDPVTRAQMAVFLVRTFDLPAAPGHCTWTETAVAGPGPYSDAALIEAIGSLGIADIGEAMQPHEVDVGDLNGDGLEDIVVHLVPDGPSLQVESREPTAILILLNNGAGDYVHGTSEPPNQGAVPGTTPVIDGVAPSYFWTRQVIVEDFNSDGLADIFLDNHGLEPPSLSSDPNQFPGEQNALWLSGQDGKLTDVTTTHLPQVLDFTHGSSAADIDGDNDLDLWINNLGANSISPYLMINDGTGRFTIVADLGADWINGPGIGPNGRLPMEFDNRVSPPFWSEFIDVTSDGYPDLYLGVVRFDDFGDRPVLLINDTTGSFDYALPTAIPPPHDTAGLPAQGTAFVDVNSDGRSDFVHWFGPWDDSLPFSIKLWINNGDGTFSDETARRLPPQSPHEIGGGKIWIRDLDGDGDSDILTTDWDRRLFYENDGEGCFSLLPMDYASFLGSRWFVPVDADGDGGGTDFIYPSGTPGDDGTTSLYLTRWVP